MRATAIFGRAARLHVRDQARLQVWDRVPWRPSLARAIHLAPPRACGLAAFVADVPPHALGRPSSATVADEPSPMSSALSRALASLHHRGPDHVGSWISPDGRVGLGHTRLSILDLAPTGNQPMTDQSGQVRAVVNGEIYDWERIRVDLESRGCRFVSRSDSEVALNLYTTFGIAGMIDQLRGEFAIAIHDDRQGVFHAVRDRFGIKPLYYARHDGRWLFASEMKALFAMGVPARWDVNHVAGSSHVWGQGNCFAGIQSVPPGHYVTLTRDGSLRLTRYFDSEFPDRNVEDTRTEEEMVLGVRERIIDAVRTRLRSDVKVGVYLSGGIDSCTALGVASSLSPTPIPAFCISFSEHKRYDEFRTAEAQAKLCGSEFHRVQVTAADLADSLESSLFHVEQAVFNLSGVAKFRLSQFVREHGIKVVLTGEGSDEIFAGYVGFREDLARYGRGIADHERQAITDSLKKGNLWFDEQLGLTPSQIRVLESTLGFVPSWFRSFSPSLLDSVLSDAAHEHIGRDRDQVQYALSHFDARALHNMKEKWDAVHSSLYIESHTLLPSMLLTFLGDRSEMAHSVEGRLPFLDHPLVEYVNQLPQRVKIKGTREKWILREAAHPFLTPEVYDRVKHPFLAPPAFLDPHSKLHDLVQSTLRSPEMSRLWWVDQSRVVAELDDLTRRLRHAEQDAPGLTPQQREANDASLLGADAKFISLVSYVMLQKLFNVE